MKIKNKLNNISFGVEIKSLKKFFNTQSNMLDEFYQWFVGFSDAESNFSIVPQYENTGNKINRFNFRFTIGLHIDDKDVLLNIQNLLGIGNITENNSECKFIVSDKESIRKLISIFDKYNLNTSKYLDYCDFKEAINLYYGRNGVLTEQLKQKLINLKEGMNTKRTKFITNHQIKITSYWLLGLIEGEGSFHLWRNSLTPVFSIVLSEQQLPVLIKVKEFLINNLGFDSYSIFKIKNSSVISLINQKPRNKSKGSILFIIKNIHILHNYLIPYLNKFKFFSKKDKDFKDFKILCQVIYFGAHKKEEIKSLILKLSKNMNNYRLSTYLGKNSSKLLTNQERNKLIDYIPLVEYLWDGRKRDLCSKKIINQNESSIYKIIKPSGKELIVQTLSEAAEIAGVNVKTLSKYLDVESTNNLEYTTLIKKHKIKRIKIFFN